MPTASKKEEKKNHLQFYYFFCNSTAAAAAESLIFSIGKKRPRLGWKSEPPSREIGRSCGGIEFNLFLSRHLIELIFRNGGRKTKTRRNGNERGVSTSSESFKLINFFRVERGSLSRANFSPLGEPLCGTSRAIGSRSRPGEREYEGSGRFARCINSDARRNAVSSEIVNRETERSSRRSQARAGESAHPARDAGPTSGLRV